MSPQLATVATMLLVAVFVLTNTVSADGSISGMYRAGFQLAQQTGANSKGVNSTGISDGVKKFFVGGEDQNKEQQTPATQDQPATQKSDSTNQNSANSVQKSDTSPRNGKQPKR